MGFNTVAVHGGFKDENKGAVNYPVYLSSTFVQPDTEHEGEYCYTRGNNPTRASVERQVADIEGAKYALATSSGMAATSLVFELLNKGDKVLINDNVYGGTWRFVSNLFEKRGLEYEVVNDLNAYDFSKVDSSVKMVFVETPSNPLLEVTDIRRVVTEAHKKNILVVVDNTFMTAYLQKPLDLGADIVEYSATKYYAGHSDLLAGLVVLNDEEIYKRLKFISNTLGGILDPFDAFLLQRGIKTLGVRMDRHLENTIKIAEYLEGNDAVEEVFYPGLKGHSGYELQKTQAKGAGAVVSFKLNTKDYDLHTFVEKLHIFDFAVSLGGVESLICRPATMTHESYAKELQEKIGITPNLLRLSVGIEDVEDLIEDLDNAFKQSKNKK
ncbi:MAG: PLP-dependent aspartate aminotransferase family protein [Lachnospiraceae bacterium]|nr:PLP-dependent aspartate aminotransferase family protein [Lachnospiraceae bacterium]